MECEYSAEGRVRICIRDEGVGIPDVEQAMEPLYTTNTDGERSGMGFTVMESFTDRLTVKSEPGKGTEVVMIKSWISAMRSDQEQKRRLETYRLIEAAQQGDEEARARLIRENTGLVSVSARKFSGGSYEYEDLMQIGYLGLLKAIDRFDPKFEVMFSTYAVPMIMGEIRRYLRDDGRIKMSRQLKQDVRLLKAAEETFMHDKGRSPRIGELAEILEKTPGRSL